jgi:hypothetical protein
LTSQRGLSGSRSITSSIRHAGTAAAPTARRQSTCSVAPTTVAMTMPTPMAIWKKRTRRPRNLAGASSATYTGAVCVAPPTANPRTTRESDNVTGSGETAAASAPTTKIAETISIVPRRPRRSLSRLQTSAPITAPARIEAAITDFQPLPMWNSSVIWSSAPEMIPVS